MTTSNPSRRWLLIGISALLVVGLCVVCALGVGGAGYVIVIRGGTQTAEAIDRTETAVAQAEKRAATQTAAARPTAIPTPPPAPQLVRVASDLPLTGASVGQTIPIVNGITLALAEQNYQACNGVWAIEYQSFDDASAAMGRWDPAVVQENANKYVADENIAAVIGPFNSGAARILLPIINPANLVLISPSSTNPGLTIPGTGQPDEPDKYYPNGLRNYARVSVADPYQTLAAAQWAAQLGAQSVFIVDDGDAVYGQLLAAEFERIAEAYGLTVVGREAMDPTTANYTALTQKMADLQPDLIYFGGLSFNNGGQLLKDIREAGVTAYFVGPDGILSQDLVEGAGAEAAAGAYATAMGVSQNELSPLGQQFYLDYQLRYGVDPEPFAIYGYTAAQIVLDAFERVCASGQPLTNRSAVRDAVMSTHNFASALGPIGFDENGDTTLVWMQIHQVQNGQWELVTAFSIER